MNRSQIHALLKTHLNNIAKLQKDIEKAEEFNKKDLRDSLESSESLVKGLKAMLGE